MRWMTKGKGAYDDGLRPMERHCFGFSLLKLVGSPLELGEGKPFGNKTYYVTISESFKVIKTRQTKAPTDREVVYHEKTSELLIMER